jgi:hypothetical protein
LRRRLALIAGFALAATSAVTDAMGGDIAKKRAAPAAVPPVSHSGIRYEAIPFGKARGLDQNGGLVAVIDEATGRELRVLRVYRIEYDPDLESDKQDLFITSLAVSADGGCLEVTDERGRRFTVDLATGQVRGD